MSKLWSVNLQDFIHGLLMAMTTAALDSVYQLLSQRAIFDWREVALVGIVAGLGFIIKQLGTDDQNKFLGKI